MAVVLALTALPATGHAQAVGVTWYRAALVRRAVEPPYRTLGPLHLVVRRWRRRIPVPGPSHPADRRRTGAVDQSGAAGPRDGPRLAAAPGRRPRQL